MIEIPVKISSRMQNAVAHLMYNYNDIWSIIILFILITIVFVSVICTIDSWAEGKNKIIKIVAPICVVINIGLTVSYGNANNKVICQIV